MTIYAEVSIACRDPRCAGPLFDRLALWPVQVATTGITLEGPVSHVLGGLTTVLGRYDDAERDRPGDTGTARDLLTEAHTVAAASGYGNVERRAAEALDGLG